MHKIHIFIEKISNSVLSGATNSSIKHYIVFASFFIFINTCFAQNVSTRINQMYFVIPYRRFPSYHFSIPFALQILFIKNFDSSFTSLKKD